MTTVINLNFLNFFKLKLDSYTINDVRSYNRYFDNGSRNDPRQWDEVIDVTPHSPATVDNDEGRGSLAGYPKKEITRLIAPPETNKTYDRKGRTIPYCLEKGAHVNSYA
ncbi:MAG: hypothetical protein HZA14_06210 [Nitrospirae bacterium]|nr:hypothetical protein [Nitrospirota bacterium]